MLINIVKHLTKTCCLTQKTWTLKAKLSLNTTVSAHIEKSTKEWHERYRWDIFSHPALISDLATSCFYLFGTSVKTPLGKQKDLRIMMFLLVKFLVRF